MTGDKIDTKNIKKSLAACKRIGGEVLFYSEIDSTNSAAMQAAKQSRCDGLVIIADYQSSGRGRGTGRNWQSAAGKNILMSVVVFGGKNELSCDQTLLKITGTAVAEGCRKACDLDENTLQIKWPNDVLADGKKLAGILIERSGDAIVIGMGINVNYFPDDAGLRSPAISLAELTGHMQVRANIVRDVLIELDECLPR